MKMTDAIAPLPEWSVDDDRAIYVLEGMSAEKFRNTMIDYGRACVETARLAADQQKGGGEVVYHVPAGAWEAASFIVGSAEDGWCDADLFVGEHTNDDGNVGYGLLVRSADYPDEGVIPLVELERTPQPSSTAPAQQPNEAVGEIRAAMEKAHSLCSFVAANGRKYGPIYSRGNSCAWALSSAMKRLDHLVQQPVGEVDNAMVERAYAAFQRHVPSKGHRAGFKQQLHAALTAALAHPPHADHKEPQS